MKTKIFKLLIVVIILGIAFSVPARAATLASMAGKTKTFLSKGAGASINTSKLETEFADLGAILTTIGAGILLIATAYMGIRYFMANPDEQARLKTQLVGLAVSAVVVFGAVSIWRLTVGIFKDM